MTWSDGTESEAPRLYANESLISDGDLVGNTQEPVRPSATGATSSTSATRHGPEAGPGPFAT